MKNGRVRGVLRMGSLRVAFSACTNGMGTVHNIDFSLGPNRALTVINRSNSNGSIADHDVVHLLTGGTGVRRKRVLFGNRSLIRGARGRVRGVHNSRVTVVFRSPVASLGPARGVNGRVTRPVVGRRGVDGSRTCGGTRRLLRLMNVPGPTGEVGRCPRRFSNKRHRQVIVTVTLNYGPSVLVTSRPAATLSIAVRTRVLRLVGSLRAGVGASVVFVARSLKIITGITSHITIVCTNGVIRMKAISRVFCGPRRPCA